MFIEHQSVAHASGWIEVICGSMFSGKTEELIRRIRRAQIAQQQIAIFKPVADKRYSEISIVSHDQNAFPSQVVQHSAEILRLAGAAEVVAIDEAQFFDDSLPQVAARLAGEGRRVIAAGLDMDYLGQPFGPMPSLMACAEFITKVHAICQVCGALANFSYRLGGGEEQVQLGEKDCYEARCRRCFHLGRDARSLLQR